MQTAENVSKKKLASWQSVRCALDDAGSGLKSFLASVIIPANEKNNIYIY